MFGFDESREMMCVQTLQLALDQYRHHEMQAQLVAQSECFQRFWSFESRVPEWNALLTRLAVEKPRTRLTAELRRSGRNARTAYVEVRRTLSARGPLGPLPISNSTESPSRRSLIPSP